MSDRAQRSILDAHPALGWAWSRANENATGLQWYVPDNADTYLWDTERECLVDQTGQRVRGSVRP